MIDLIKKRPLLITSLLVLLILTHGFFNKYFDIDNVTILLVVLIILLPYIPLLSKIKIPGLEAEFFREAVDKVGEKASEIPDGESDSSKSKKAEELSELAEDDPTLALAKARIEIEKRVRSLAEIYLQEPSDRNSLGKLITQLSKAQVIDQPLSALLRDMVTVANQAIHGSNIQNIDVTRLVGYAARAIDELDDIVIDRALKSESKVINQKVVDLYRDARYIVKTIVPLTEKPEMKTYTVNQSELDALLEGYDEYGEFIVSLERIKSEDK